MTWEMNHMNILEIFYHWMKIALECLMVLEQIVMMEILKTLILMN